MDLLVGCPIRRRNWALNHWFAGVEMACLVVDVAPSYIFVADPRDEETVSGIRDITLALGRSCHMIWTEEETDDNSHVWTHERYHHMVELRNKLLSGVRYLQPELFLSCDSDIFMHERSLSIMLDLLEGPHGFGAVGSKAYLSKKGTWAPNYALLPPGGGLRREEETGILTVQCLMALKLMTPAAYAVDYEPHHQGEDVGWSIACRRRKIKLGWSGEVASKHVMSPELIDQIDTRCGY